MPGYGQLDQEYGIRLATTAPEDDGPVGMDQTIVIGDGRSWHQVRFNTFPSRRAFMAVALDPDRTEAHSEHRDSAIADTYALGIRASINDLARSLSDVK